MNRPGNRISFGSGDNSLASLMDSSDAGGGGSVSDCRSGGGGSEGESVSEGGSDFGSEGGFESEGGI